MYSFLLNCESTILYIIIPAKREHWFNVDNSWFTEDQHWSLNYQRGMWADHCLINVSRSLFNQCEQIIVESMLTDKYWINLDILLLHVLLDIVCVIQQGIYGYTCTCICINACFTFCNVEFCSNQCWRVNVSKCYEINTIINSESTVILVPAIFRSLVERFTI